MNTICTASPTPIKKSKKTLVSVHEGMLSIARNLWQELEKFIDMSAPGHKFVFCGHSIGGSLSLLLLILMTNSRGGEFQNKTDTYMPKASIRYCNAKAHHLCLISTINKIL